MSVAAAGVSVSPHVMITRGDGWSGPPSASSREASRLAKAG
jgi:hypothetical protein